MRQGRVGGYIDETDSFFVREVDLFGRIDDTGRDGSISMFAIV